MDITCTLSNNRALVGLSGRMDAVTAPAFEQHCESLITQGTTAVIADMPGLEYISSAGLRSILSSAKKLRTAGGNLSFCGMTGMVDEVFRVSGFFKMFRVFATKDEALAE
ncbi:STAS domain-containing protein [Nitratidesulfovibrio vulgaris]|uniref:STAS domain-containing protein n=1 Tax=Nitratidesulfovibrio vulgaris TaxID=881 RepID=UPI0023011A4E|nr:STAS domain-containing protein [Nitratidesulfovibrio vulgaris]WCB45538.1 STAS domain-containing protein [Nitratidesulfovibrio vulgaris]